MGVVVDCVAQCIRSVKCLGRRCILRIFLLLLCACMIFHGFRVVSVISNLNGKGDYYLISFKSNLGVVGLQKSSLQESKLTSFSGLCRFVPPGLRGEFSGHFNDSSPPSWEKITDANPKYRNGTGFRPNGCKARHRVAIIIPLRNRETQLRTLLAHMHPIWQRHQIEYKVYVITQSGDEFFNRAKLLNVGFAEASKVRKYDCYVFHDVDMLAENDRCLYHCSMEHPRQIAKRIDVNEYNELAYPLLCPTLSFYRQHVHYFGGVSMMSHEQFLEVNGFSNLYWGWGGEDDDMYLRIWSRGYDISHANDDYCRFHMIKHKHESTNAENNGRYSMLYHATSRMYQDGLNTLKYRRLSYKRNSLYTNITVDLGKPSSKILSLFSNGRFSNCGRRMPWN